MFAPRESATAPHHPSSRRASTSRSSLRSCGIVARQCAPAGADHQAISFPGVRLPRPGLGFKSIKFCIKFLRTLAFTPRTLYTGEDTGFGVQPSPPYPICGLKVLFFALFSSKRLISPLVFSILDTGKRAGFHFQPSPPFLQGLGHPELPLPPPSCKSCWIDPVAA